MMKIHIEFQNQFKYWIHYTTKNHYQDAVRVAENRVRLTSKKHRLVDDSGCLLEQIDP